MNLTRLSARSVRRRPKEAVMIGIAILAATAFAATALLLSINARSAIVSLGSSTPSAADIIVFLAPDVDPSGVPALADSLGALPGTDDVVVEYVGDVVVDAEGTTGVWTITSDPGTGPLTAVPTLTDGRAPELGEVVIGERTAERIGATPGTSILIGGEEFIVSGVGHVPGFGQDVALVREQDAAALGDAMLPVRLLIVGTPTAASVDAAVAIADGSSELRSAVLTGEQLRADEESGVTNALAGLFAALAVFVGLAMVAAIVIVSSTFRVLLGRRAAELSLLRSIGATQRQVTRLVRIEAAVVGLAAGALGTGMGLALAWGIYLVAGNLGLAVEPFAAAPPGLVACVVLAIVTAVIAASPAAKAAGRKPPIAALGSAQSVDAQPVHRRRRLILAALAALLALATAAAGFAFDDQQLGLAFGALSGLAAFAALMFCAPMLVVLAAALLRPLISGSASARLALSTVRRASRRTSAMTTTLTLGVGMTAALLVGVAGATEDAQQGIESTFAAEVLIPLSYVDDPDALIDSLRAHPALEVSTDTVDILVDPAAGVDAEELRSAVIETTRGITTTIFWAEDSRIGVDQFILVGQGIGFAMIGTTLLVALIGVAVSLALSVAERRQELALLRALGVSKSGVRRSIAVEAALAGAVGSVVGTVVGALYGYVALGVLDFATGSPPLLSLAVLCLGVTSAAVAAAVIPLYQAGRIEPAAGLAAR